MKILFVAAAVSILILNASCRQAPAGVVAPVNSTPPDVGISINSTQTQMVGKAAPLFQLNDLNGKSVSLADFRGKPVIVTFWTSWSQDCQMEMPVLQQIYDKWKSQGLVVLAVDIANSRPDETFSNVQTFVSGAGYSFPVLFDEKQIATIQYHVAETPTNYFIDKDGFIREITPGPFLSVAAFETSLTRISAIQ